MRRWQRDLSRDVNSEIARIARADDERRQAAARGLDLEEFLRAFLDGAIGDAGPFTTQDDAIAACERCLAERIRRPLHASERARVGIAFALAWNARVARASRDDCAAAANADIAPLPAANPVTIRGISRGAA